MKEISVTVTITGFENFNTAGQDNGDGVVRSTQTHLNIGALSLSVIISYVSAIKLTMQKLKRS